MAAQLPRLLNGICVCSVCCYRVWESFYDCDELTWSAPSLVSSETIEGPCGTSGPWVNDGSGSCRATYIQYVSLTYCQSCGDVSPVAPPDNTDPAPEGCCADCCCLWVFGAGFDCETGIWTVSPPSPGVTVPGPCPSDGEWTPDGGDPCTAYRTMYTPAPTCEFGEPCAVEDAPDPGEPDYFPWECCETCCYTEWVSGWDCESEEWSEPSIDFQASGVPCGEGTDWYIDTGGLGPCVAKRLIYSVPDDCSEEPVTIPKPELSPGLGCCDGCTYCVGETQPSLTVSGFTGPDCSFINGTYAYIDVSSDPSGCTWHWESAFFSVNVRYETGSGSWSYTAGFKGSYFDAPDVGCLSGVITGTITGTASAPFACIGQSFTITLG